MCGIAGFVGDDDPRLISEMTGLLSHRGPDGEGFRCFGPGGARPPAALGHRRLSIIDLTEMGAQPMSYSDERYWITYNGEIYNFRELRDDLARAGFVFRSQCDTEVLLAMYARYGAAMLPQLNGIFAFAVWDTVSGELFLARDRLGVKPLYHTQRNGVLYFASEVKSILAATGGAGLSHAAVADFLTFLWVPDPDTLFEGVSKLAPGHYAVYAEGRLSIRAYWDMRFEPEPGEDKIWAGRVRDSVRAAVQRQSVADVPLGSFLSGGIDSSAIVAELSRSRRVPTYTVGFSAEDLEHEIVPDDVRYSREMAEEFNIEYFERTLSADVVDLLPRLVWHMDEPVADPAAVTTYLICAAARERLTVVMSGVGGDELFAGYPRHLAARIARATDIFPRQFRSMTRRTLEGRLTVGKPGRLRGPRRNVMKLLRGLDASPRERYLTYCSYYRPDELPRVLSSELRSSLRGHDPFRQHRDYFDRVASEHWLNQLLYVDMKTFLPCLNLTYTDKMSMAASTEVRVPLLDDEIVAMTGKIPPDLKLKRLTRKYILKRSMEGVLPRDIIWRPKAGFGAPVRAWLVGDLKPLMEDVLSPENVARRGLLDPAEVQRQMRANEAGSEDNALRLWAMLTLELWQQAFLDGRPSRSSTATAWRQS